jgi:hypothetical protein
VCYSEPSLLGTVRVCILSVTPRYFPARIKAVRTPSTTIVTTTLVLSILSVSSVLGQKVGGAGGAVKTAGSGSGGRTTPTTREKTVYKTRIVKERVTPTTGSLSVAAESNAAIVVEPIKRKDVKVQQGIVPDGEKIFVFNDLKPGQYRVEGTLPRHHAVQTEVTIAANKSETVTLDFKPILYSVIVNTNISSGDLKYGSDGQSLSNVIPIQNKKVELNLPEGSYVLEIVPKEFGYEPLRHAFSLSADRTVLDLPLKRIVLTTDTLSPIWTTEELQAWDMPPTWRPDSKKNLLVKGSGVALPRQESLRFYKDFRISSSAKTLSGFGLSFALRARDSRNYYLLQLTGEKSDEPFMVRLFVVKNGVEQRIRALPIPRSSAKAMAPGEFFGVSIKMVDFAITVEIEDSQTGDRHLLGVLTDPDRNFAVGAVGIAGRENEDNVIGRFVVCTGDKCLNETSGMD